MSSRRSPTDLTSPREREEGLSARRLHDLRGPISVIRGHARILLDGYKGELNDTQRRSVSAIERQVRRLGDLLRRCRASPRDVGATSARIETFPVGSDSSPSILIADDDPEILELLGSLLASRYRLTFAQDGREALALLLSRSFQLTIVDIELPHLDGFALVDAARRAGEAPAFLFLSAHADSQAKVRALSMGAADYVTKPFDTDELAARIARVIATVNRENSLRAEALTDQLTGLSNYRSLMQSLDRELERSRRYSEPLSLITLDLDHLKAINDEHGHDAGNDAHLSGGRGSRRRGAQIRGGRATRGRRVRGVAPQHRARRCREASRTSAHRNRFAVFARGLFFSEHRRRLSRERQPHGCARTRQGQRRGALPGQAQRA